ncbi:MAG: VWA domain-containing protein [Verrucomicrobia bacterium]|nr:VWA domain-containing protein [Verrucomicrobiota bacterium]
MSFAYPEVFFLLLLVPLILVGTILASRKRGQAWKKLVATRLESILVRSGSAVPRWISFALALLAFALLITALAAPNAGYEEENETIRGRNLLLAIDISRSMLADDESPNRLAAALAASLEVLDHFPNDRIGLIAFSGSAFLQAPLTVDHGAVRESIQQLDPVMLQQLDADWMPRGGSDVSQAVHLAIDTFKETGQKNNALIIFSDGEHHEGGYEEAAEAAAEQGLTIFTAGFGSNEGAFLPDPQQTDGRFRDSKGNLVFSRLNTDGLRLLARKTDGFYTSGSGRHFAGNLETAVERLERYELEGRKHRVAIPRFQWFLLPAIVLFILSMLINTPWQSLGRAAAVILALLCLPQSAKARLLPPTPAEKAFERGEFELALEHFDVEIVRSSGDRLARLQLGAGAAAYRLQDFDRAASAYSAALLSADPRLQSDAHYALGNALFKRGDHALQSADEKTKASVMKETISGWTNALQHYEDCLQLTPDHQEAKDNHAFVKRRLDELQQEQQKQKQEQEQEDQEDQQKQDGDQQKDDEENKDEQGEDGDQQQDQQKDQQKGDQEGEEGEEGEPKDGENPEDSQGDQSENEQGKSDREGQENQGNQGQPQGDPRNANDSGKQEGEPQPREGRPDETPEEHARRILAENADFQMTPLMREPKRSKRPEKDW